MYRRFSAFLTIALLAGCANTLDSPSLAVRPSEAAARIDAARPAAVVTPITIAEKVPLEAATIARLETSIRAAQASVAPFATASEPARAAVALAEVDAVRRELVASGKNFDRDALAKLLNIVAEIDADQQAQVTALINSLKSR
jgi:hypothetical protein